MIRLMTCVVGVVLVLSGCAPVYTLEGKSYSSAEEFRTAHGTMLREARKTLVSEMRLSAPVSQKSLLVGVPTQAALVDAMARTTPGGSLNAMQRTMAETLALQYREEAQFFGETLRDIGVYREVKIVDTSGAHLQPSSSESVFYFLTTTGTGQYYLNGGRTGLQAANLDRGQPNLEGKARSMVNSVKAYALTD